jgi:tetratricopeptide (TPR) repeat protein
VPSRTRSSSQPPPDDERQKQLRRLRDSASFAVLKGRYYDGLEFCKQLEELDPDDPAWARRTAYCCHRLGMHAGELAALIRAAEGYEKGGFLRKAVAMYRLALALDPTDEYLHNRIDDLNAGKSTGLESLRGPGMLQFLTHSEVPPVPSTPPKGDGEAPPIPRADSIPSIDPSGTFEREAARLIDEYELVEFADTEIVTK